MSATAAAGAGGRGGSFMKALLGCRSGRCSATASPYVKTPSSSRALLTPAQCQHSYPTLPPPPPPPPPPAAAAAGGGPPDTRRSTPACPTIAWICSTTSSALQARWVTPGSSARSSSAAGSTAMTRCACWASTCVHPPAGGKGKAATGREQVSGVKAVHVHEAEASKRQRHHTATACSQPALAWCGAQVNCHSCSQLQPRSHQRFR
jgi:hypothetical protein